LISWKPLYHEGFNRAACHAEARHDGP